jgi:hypothetical protein
VGLRVGLVVLTLLAFFGSWCAARWYAGSEIALAATQLPENALGAAETANRLAPGDPMAHWSLASLEQRSLGPDALKASIAEYEKAVSLSPSDFRLWTDLGRAKEQADDIQGAEHALRRGVELAPYYAWPRWHLGNFLVRRGRFDEGLAELRRVAETDPSKRGMVFDLAWMIYGGEVNTVKGTLGNSPSVQADFVSYLLGRGRLDEALQLWNGLSAQEKTESEAIGKSLIDSLLAAKRHRDVLGVSRDLAGGKSPAEIGKISNGSFEAPIPQGGGLFDWKVQSVPQASVALESGGAQNGELSLRVNFNAPGALDFNITQLVAVEPATSYRLTFYVKANNLKSASMPVVQVLIGEGTVLAESASPPAGKSDWQQFSLDFKTPPKIDGIAVRISRKPCTAEEGVCPIFGTVWYDNFNLQLAGR